MKIPSQLLIKLAIGLTIFLGVLIILVTNEKSFKSIINDDIENISKLSSSIIYAEIDNSLTKPIFVGLTMANDLFLKNWLESESSSGATVEQAELMQQYLFDYCSKYGYDSVSVISQKSGTYYFQNGINKVISTQDKHDVWYYDFIKTEKPYVLNVDVDEANNNELTVFSDCRIAGSNGELLGVVGVGIKMNHLQELLNKYETDYDLKAFIINSNGLIQVDSNDANIEKVNFFESPQMSKLEDHIVNSKGSMQVFWYSELSTDHCLITKYINNLDWYIIIDKDTSIAHATLTTQINHNLLFIGIIIIAVIVLISFMISRYNHMLLKTATIDDVTNLPNIKMFQEIFKRNAKRRNCCKGILFMFDIDYFKEINDQFGHLFGNTILYRISEIAKEIIGTNGVIARWGGDEFIGVIYSGVEETTAILNEICDKITNISEHDGITVSVGATIITDQTTLDNIANEADTALYRSKINGRGRITFFEES